MASDPEVLEAEEGEEEALDESEDESDDEPVVSLATGREKRINQGNRMRALLEEEGLIEDEELFREEEDDVDFQAKEEEDVFDSDFGSTDSGSGGEDDAEDAGEKRLIQDAKAERREARGKKKKTAHTPFLPSFARQTKHQARKPPVASTSNSTLDGTSDAPPPKRRKISMAAVNLIAGIAPRESSRKSAVAFKKTIEVRLLENEQRRATLPKPVKKAAVSLTQADLIGEALETEEINRASLLAFYAAEEDRRAADRIAGLRHEIVGPRITFLSRLEGVPRAAKKDGKIIGSSGAVSAAEKLESGRRRLIEVIGEAGKEGWRPNMGMGDGPPGAASTSTVAIDGVNTAIEPQAMAVDGSGSSKSPIASSLPSATLPDVHPPVQLNSDPPPAGAGVASSSSSSTTILSSNPAIVQGLSDSRDVTPKPHYNPPSQFLPTSSLPPLPPDSLPALNEPYARNYLILSDFEGTRQEEMGAILGQHHEWGTVKIVPSRSRVLNRKVPICPLTGLPAPYRDPRTMTPYSSLAAYKTLTAVIEQSYPWDQTLGVFTGKSGWGLQKELEDRLPAHRKGKAVAGGDNHGAGSRSARNRVKAGDVEMSSPGPAPSSSGLRRLPSASPHPAAEQGPPSPAIAQTSLKSATAPNSLGKTATEPPPPNVNGVLNGSSHPI
ncbi:vacuolar protein sorting-associated protein 72, partial [Phenoliferia sp. Uapishka_3]